MAISDRINIKKALVLAAAPLAALALVGVVSAGGSTTAAPSATPSPSATSASPSVTPSPSATSASPSATPSATASYSESDKAAFLSAVQDQTEEIWLEADADIVSLADTIVDAHGRGVAWNDVVTVLKKQYPAQDSEIYIRLVVSHLMKDLPASDPWKVAAAKPHKAEKPKPAPKPKPEPTEEAERDMTAGQEQAVGKAEDYLDYSHFSKKGLIKQLKYEGFSGKEAEFAVEHIKVSWKDQAAGKADDYLEYSHFSRSSLIRQLKYEGFTKSQAEYGAKKAGL